MYSYQGPGRDPMNPHQRKRGRRRLPERERRVRRLVQNRISARKCRTKKKEQFISLYEESKQLKVEVQMLHQQVDVLQKALADKDRVNCNTQHILPNQENNRKSAFSTYDVTPNMQEQALPVPPPHPCQNSSQYVPPSSCVPPASAFCECTSLNQLRDPSMHPTVGGAREFFSSVYWFRLPPSLTLPQPWNVEIEMNWHMHQNPQSTSFNTDAPTNYNQPASPNFKPFK